MPEREILNSISPKISHQVIHLLREAQLGISSSTVRISDLYSSCPTVTCIDFGICDRFKVGIQYAGQTLTWEVLFDCNSPDEPPDFIFGSEDADFFPDIDKIPSLVMWDYQEPSCLLRVLEQLLDQYRQHQETVISGLSRLSFEYSSLIKDTDTVSDDVEIHVAKSENRVGPINFLIKVHVDFSRIPAYIVRLNPGEDIAVLQVTFNTADGTRITPQLYLSPRVERALGGPASLRIPGFPVGACLSEYVPELTALLKNKVDQIVQCYERRKEYIAAFLSLYGRSVLEYDAEGFSKISFLFEWNDFFFIVMDCRGTVISAGGMLNEARAILIRGVFTAANKMIDLPPFFPKDQPSITFQSIYHELKGKPYAEVFQDYPYSPRWGGLEMAERARSFILEMIGNFQKSSVVTCAT